MIELKRIDKVHMCGSDADGLACEVICQMERASYMDGQGVFSLDARAQMHQFRNQLLLPMNSIWGHVGAPGDDLWREG